MKKFAKQLVSIFSAAALSVSAFPLGVCADSASKAYEAEKAKLSGVKIFEDKDFSSGKYVQIESSGSCEFSVSVSKSGFYDFSFVSAGIGGDKENNALLDGESMGTFKSEADSLGGGAVNYVYVSKGSHKVKVTPSWGWIKLDRLIITQSRAAEDLYSVSGKLINPNASKSAKKVMKFICDNYGKNVISGQQSDGGLNGAEFSAIKAATGKTPAILGLDLMDYTPSRIKKGASGSAAVEKAVEFSEAGGIVTMSWHWNAPAKYIKSGNDKNGNPRWWGGFYTENVKNLDLEKIMNGKDKEGYKLLMSDIDAIAEQLKKLQKKDVPVLFRPLHEASGGWFWWGSDGPEAYKKLWKTMYDRLTNKHGLNNLIWVWNGQSADWYPGDEYVDIIGEDIYPPEHDYSAQTSKFRTAADYPDSVNKVVALTENGVLFDIDKAKKSDSVWSWFCVWSGDFCVKGDGAVSEKYTEEEMWKKVYNHKNVLTLEDSKKYLEGSGKK